MKPKALSKLIWVLDNGTVEEQCHTLKFLCPCRNRVYDQEIWHKIFNAKESEDPRVRDRAEHAIETFNQLAMKEIRWRDLAFQLKEDLNLPMTIGDFFSEELSKLEVFCHEGKITKILYKVKSGNKVISSKAATIYCCEAQPSTGMELIAAKIYPGRGHNTKAAYEFDTLHLLYEAGSDVPKPIACSNGVILMEWVAAPKLENLSLERDEAQRLFYLLMRNVEIWLAAKRVHGQLSEANILYWKGKVKVIDFAQAIDPFSSPNGFTVLAGDVSNLCRYFSQYGIQTNPHRMVERLWRKYLNRNSQSLQRKDGIYDSNKA